jgi:flagellar protein FliS
MTQTQVNPYLRTKVLTAGPLELRLMLFDGAIKFCRQAADAIGRSDWEGMYNGLVRAQKIVMELSTSLDHDEAPELCSRMAALYTYIYRRLIDANLERDDAPVHESIRLLEYERETWQMLMRQVNSGSEATVPNPVGRIGPDEGEKPSAGSLSIEG